MIYKVIWWLWFCGKCSVTSFDLKISQSNVIRWVDFEGNECVVGAGPHPRGLSGRVITAIWWLFSLVLLASFFASLSSWLHSESQQLSIKSFEDLANQNVIEYGTIKDSSSMSFFKVKHKCCGQTSPSALVLGQRPVCVCVDLRSFKTNQKISFHQKYCFYNQSDEKYTFLLKQRVWCVACDELSGV